MKKLLTVLAVLAMAVPAYSQTWHTANQVTLAWDAVAKVQTTDQPNKYQVYTKVNATGVPQKVGAEITATQQAITFAT
jgi:hypothetical protein